MKVKKIHIEKFRGFEDVTFSIGEHLTAIAGQNGTQKTTVLGLLSQPFSINLKKHPMFGEKPLCGGNYKSGFAEKFKLSNNFDKPKKHEWSLYLRGWEEPFTVESIKRHDSETVRFWKKGDRSKGSGYIAHPVIFLSLSRLLPLGEDEDIDIADIYLTDEEKEFVIDWHKKILLICDDLNETTEYLESKNKNTLGLNTDIYDWNQNSAGQDNVGKILLAILSFKRLKEKYPKDYSGGILAIDELDATLYPAAQEMLVDALAKFASDYDLQIIFTTHSLNLLQYLDSKSEGQKKKNKVIVLKKIDEKVTVIEDCSYQDLEAMLNVTKSQDPHLKKLNIFSEDDEADCFIKQILGTSITKHLKFQKCKLGAGNYINLAKNKIPGFCSPDSIIILDGDQKPNSIKSLNNFLILPGGEPPEKLLARFLGNLKDKDPIWQEIDKHYNRQVCFRSFSRKEVLRDRDKAKKWFREQKPSWGRNASKVINPWIKQNQEEVDKFIKSFTKAYNKIATKLNLAIIEDN
ncbi:MAG: AAA family ATPase [bacterium]